MRGKDVERLLLRSALLLPNAFDEPVERGSLLIEGDRIASVGPFSALRRSYPLARERDCGELLALPGLVDAHSHGRALPSEAQGITGGPLELFLLRLTAFTPLDPFDDALVAGTDLVATGVTSAQAIFHSYAPADAYPDGARAAFEGLRRSGLRCDLALGITDQYELMPPTALEEREVPRCLADLLSVERGLDPDGYFEAFDRLREELDDEARRILLGPVAPQWCSDRIWSDVRRRMDDGVRVHTHLLESRLQRSPLYGDPPVAKLDRLGILSPSLSAAHGVWLLDEEIGLLADRGASVIHCPASNTRLGVGTARVREWRDAGVASAFGLDSNALEYPPDAFAELRHLRNVARDLEAPVAAREALYMATIGGARALGRERELGVLEPGTYADVSLVHMERTPRRREELAGAILDGASRSSVAEVWVAGRMQVEDGTPVRSSEVHAARRRLRADLERDRPRREQRLQRLRTVEPWLLELWSGVAEEAERVER